MRIVRDGIVQLERFLANTGVLKHLAFDLLRDDPAERLLDSWFVVVVDGHHPASALLLEAFLLQISNFRLKLLFLHPQTF